MNTVRLAFAHYVDVKVAYFVALRMEVTDLSTHRAIELGFENAIFEALAAASEPIIDAFNEPVDSGIHFYDQQRCEDFCFGFAGSSRFHYHI